MIICTISKTGAGFDVLAWKTGAVMTLGTAPSIEGARHLIPPGAQPFRFSPETPPPASVVESYVLPADFGSTAPNQYPELN